MEVAQAWKSDRARHLPDDLDLGLGEVIFALVGDQVTPGSARLAHAQKELVAMFPTRHLRVLYPPRIRIARRGRCQRTRQQVSMNLAEQRMGVGIVRTIVELQEGFGGKEELEGKHTGRGSERITNQDTR